MKLADKTTLYLPSKHQYDPDIKALIADATNVAGGCTMVDARGRYAVDGFVITEPVILVTWWQEVQTYALHMHLEGIIKRLLLGFVDAEQAVLVERTTPNSTAAWVVTLDEEGALSW